MLVSLAGCATMDRDTGKALGTTGVTAAHAIADVSDSARRNIDKLPEWQAVHDALSCSVVQTDLVQKCLDGVQSRPNTPQTALADVMAKRASAASALANAYQSFVDLATYDAGVEAENSINHAMAAVNDLTGAVNKLVPSVPAAPITATITAALAGAAGLAAAERQQQQLMAASKDLHQADVALITALTAERDQLATDSLLGMLQNEQDKLYESFVDAGLMSTSDALQPVLTQIAPGAQISQKPTADIRVIRRAAEISLATNSRRQQAAVKASYDAALGALQALAAAHANLEAKQPLNLQAIIAQASRIQTLVNDLKPAVVSDLKQK